MAPKLDHHATEAKARELLNTRIASVRGLVTARQNVTDLREQLAAAERADVAAYAAALKDGWTVEELRALSLGEPDKRARVRRRATARKPAPAQNMPEHVPADAGHENPLTELAPRPSSSRRATPCQAATRPLPRNRVEGQPATATGWIELGDGWVTKMPDGPPGGSGLGG